MSLPLKELISIGAKQLRDAGVADADIDAKELYCFMQGMNRTDLIQSAIAAHYRKTGVHGSSI